MDFAGAANDFLPAPDSSTPAGLVPGKQDARSANDWNAYLKDEQDKSKTPQDRAHWQQLIDQTNATQQPQSGPTYQMSARDGSNPSGRAYGFGEAANDFLNTQDAPRATAPIGPNTAKPDAAGAMAQQTAGLGDPGMVGVGENVLHSLTGMASLPIAGLAGLKGLITGGADAGADAVRNAQEAMTYQPRTQAGQAIQQGIGSASAKVGDIASTPIRPYQAGSIPSALDLNPINLPGNVASAGYPGVATALRMVPDMAAALTAPGIGSAARTGLDAVSDAMAPRVMSVADRIEPSFGAKPTATTVPPVAPVAPPVTPSATAAARHAEASSLPVPVQLTEGQATGDVNLISDEMNKRGKSPALADRFNQQNGQLIQNMDAIKAKVAPDVTVPDATTLGQSRVDAYKTMDAARQDDITAKYQALKDANGGQFPVDGKAIVSSSQAALQDAGKARFLPAEVKDYMSDFGGENAKPMTFNDYENMRTTLAAAARKADRAGDGNAMGAINIVRNQVEALPLTTETAELKPLADAARKAAKSRFDAIKQDPAYKAAVNDDAGLNEPSPLADKFVQKYIVNAPAANVGRMLGNLPDAVSKQEVAAGLMDHLKAQSVNTAGNVKQDAYGRVLKAPGFNQKLDLAFDPASAQQVRTLGNVATYTQAQPIGSYVNNSNTAVTLAKGAAEHGANVAFGGIPVGTSVRYLGGKLADRAATKRALAPNAGVNLSDLVK